ncbi:MAG: glycosyltransferase family 4 protein [Sulfurovum sp.]|nr:glycosyltransferase family 4 protein [Sulfurovum sp.]
MKVCQVLAGTGYGGLEKHTIELSKGLKQQNIDVTVIAHKDFAQYFEGIDFIPMDLQKSRNNLWMRYRLYKVLKNGSFDIVHTQANKATDIVVKIKPFLNFKMISTLHNIKRNLSSFEKSDFVITVSDKIGEKLKNRNKQTIYNGISYEKMNDTIDLRKKYGFQAESFVICTIARLTKAKRLDVLLQGLAKTKNINLILVGGGEEETNLKKLVDSLGIKERVEFTGAMENKEVKQIIANSDAFVMTSDNEGFPYTFVETMFCHTPFISTPVSDIEKFIGQEYIIPFGDYKALAKKLEDVKNNYSRVEQDFVPIFQKAVHEFTVENMVKQTIKVYEKVMGSGL